MVQFYCPTHGSINLFQKQNENERPAEIQALYRRRQ